MILVIVIFLSSGSTTTIQQRMCSKATSICSLHICKTTAGVYKQQNMKTNGRNSRLVSKYVSTTMDIGTFLTSKGKYIILFPTKV